MGHCKTPWDEHEHERERELLLDQATLAPEPPCMGGTGCICCGSLVVLNPALFCLQITNHEVQDEESLEGGKCWRQESKEKGEGEESKVNSYYTNL